ncbi:MAG: TonB-dependent receptor, partial [Pseudomonadota bacterium]
SCYLTCRRFTSQVWPKSADNRLDMACLERPLTPDLLTTHDKALAVNLKPDAYGTFAEIGAGQEVVRWFFRVGGAAGTISKSISAYDMQVSDAIYGKCKRYVCRDRLDSMLDAEQSLNHSRLTEKRGANTAFFTFADTVSARNFHGTNECHGWLGVRFQSAPGVPDSQITVHIRMLDNDNQSQQEALGIVGVNLIYGSIILTDDPDTLLASLLDNLTPQRIEIDMIEFSGPHFSDVDNRIMALRLVQLGFTGAAMFAADGSVVQPAEVLRKKSLVVARGRFRPITNVNIDMIRATKRQLATDYHLNQSDVLPIMEITMRDLMQDGEVCLADFISRAEVLETTGHMVMISDFFEFYRLAAFLFRCTNQPIGITMGLGTMMNVFDDAYYETLEGGLLGSFGRLFRQALRLYVYPQKDQTTGVVDTVDTVKFNNPKDGLLDYLQSIGSIVQLRDIKQEYLDILSTEVLQRIASGDSTWTSQVPEPVAEAIRTRRLFGYAA